jgi:hypothetical protein
MNSTKDGMMLNDNQKRIYNLYLRAYRTNNGQPFRAKKNFKDVESDEEILLYLKKLENVFCKYPAFFNDTYFNAPYIIYPDDKKYFSLKFFSSQKGIGTCIAYYKILLKSDPEKQFEFFKASYKFIAEFCIEKGLELREYTGYCSIAQNDCLKHLKEHKISWYVVFTIPQFYDLLFNMPKDEFELYYGSDIDLVELYTNFKNSTKTQNLLAEMHKKVSLFVQKTLQNKRILDK